MQARVKAITLHTYQDDDPDLSYLEPDSGRYDDVDDVDQRAKYQAEDAERLANYGETWGVVGLRAVAHVEFQHAEHTFQQGPTLESGGLWGIETDSSPDYFLEVWSDELSSLNDQLAALNLSTDGVPVEIVSTTDDPESIDYRAKFTMVDR